MVKQLERTLSTSFVNIFKLNSIFKRDHLPKV